MRIVYRVDNRPTTKFITQVKPGTVFSGVYSGSEGPWLRTHFGIVNLRDIDRSVSNLCEGEIINYREHDAELVLS